MDNTMTRFTPGPWAVCEDGLGVYAPETDTAITNPDHPCAPDYDEALANYRLIAAVPDMLAALQLAEVQLFQLYKREVSTLKPHQQHMINRPDLLAELKDEHGFLHFPAANALNEVRKAIAMNS